MTNQSFPQEIIEIANGAVRMMLEDGVTVDMFKANIENMTSAYINAYIDRQRKMCMDYLTSDTTRQAALDVLLGMLKSK